MATEVVILGAAQRGQIALVSGPAEIEQAVRIILNTAPGQRVMRPEFGCRLHEVAAAIQRGIKQAIEDMTGLQVKEVNVLVKKLNFQDKNEATG